MSKKRETIQGQEQADSRVRLYPDGKYRWVYEVPMLRNPTILFDVFKVLFISFGIVWLFNISLIACDGKLSLGEMASFSGGFVLLLLFMLFLGCVAYVLVAWYYGWYYVVLFTMDETEVKHQQMPRQVKKAQVIGALTVLLGSVSGRPGMSGTGLLASERTSSTSTLVKVKRLVPKRRYNLIKVNQLLNKNRIFVREEDFDFVYGFLCQHCINAQRS